jgi:hypothetical protein
MRTFTFLGVAVGLGLAAGFGLLRSETGTRGKAERIAVLIKQLGDVKFARRQAASKALEAIGAPALGPLARAARASADLEICRRAEKLILVIARRLDRTDVERVPPPKGAVVLFNGKNLDAWVGRDGESDPAWVLQDDGVMEASEADIRTRRTFAGGYKLHVEFRIPSNPENTVHGRGNSGVYLHGHYEVQILDSYGPEAQEPTAIHHAPAESCGAIFGQTAPRVNVCKAPGFWQSYDIEFQPARFKGGRKVKDPRVTVFHNGVLIHDQVAIRVDDTGQGLEHDVAEPGPVLLQYHSSPVQFRNIWLVPLPKR